MEVAVLDDYGRAYEPDAIIYGAVGNDMCLPNFVRRRSALGAPGWLTGEELSALLSRLREGKPRSLSLFDSQFDEANVWDICVPGKAPPGTRRLVGPQAFLGALDRLESIGRGLGVPVVAVDPRGHTFVGGIRDRIEKSKGRFEATRFWLFDKEIDGWLSDHGYDDFNDSPLPISQKDAHLSALGNGLLAQWLYDRMEKSGLVAELVARTGGAARGVRTASPEGAAPGP
jgi:hypothetical protein